MPTKAKEIRLDEEIGENLVSSIFPGNSSVGFRKKTALSYFLRHHRSLNMTEDGYVSVEELL